MRHWPLTQLTITTPDLILHVPDDQLLDDLAHLAGQGVHSPGTAVFPQPWTNGTPDEVADNVLRNHWWARADWRGTRGGGLVKLYYYGASEPDLAELARLGGTAGEMPQRGSR